MFTLVCPPNDIPHLELSCVVAVCHDLNNHYQRLRCSLLPLSRIYLDPAHHVFLNFSDQMHLIAANYGLHFHFHLYYPGLSPRCFLQITSALQNYMFNYCFWAPKSLLSSYLLNISASDGPMQCF